MTRLLRLAIIFGIMLMLFACGDNTSVTEQNSAAESNPPPIEVTLLIDGYRATISAYGTPEYSPYISISELITELEARHIPFDAQEFMDDTYVRAEDIIPYVNFEMNVVFVDSSHVIIPIYTEELIVGEQERRIIIDFLSENYLQIFKQEMVHEYYGEGIGSLFAGDFMLFDLGGGVPGISLRLMDAGSTGMLVYLYAEGGFQQLGHIFTYDLFHDNEGRIVECGMDSKGAPCYYFITFINGEWHKAPASDGIELTPARILGSLRNEVNDAIDQRMWQTAAHPSGAIVDIQIPKAIVDIVIEYFEHNMAEIWGEEPSSYRIDEIKWSLINENLIRVKATHNNDIENWFWLELSDEGDNIENCLCSWWWIA